MKAIRFPLLVSRKGVSWLLLLIVLFVYEREWLIVFNVSYIINDCIAEVWGFRKARLIIWMGFLMNFMVVAMGQLAVALPAASFWEGEESFNFVFGMAPRIAVASLTAFLVGSKEEYDRILANKKNVLDYSGVE